MRPPDARGVALAIVIGIALAGLVVWGSYAPVPANPCAPTGGNTPLGATLAISPPAETTFGGQHWYNFSIQSAGSVTAFHDLSFMIQTAGGGAVPREAMWNLTGWRSTDHALLGIYAWSSNGTGSWIQGGSTPITTLEVLSLFTGGQVLSGDDFVAILAPNVCGWGGSISVAIP